MEFTLLWAALTAVVFGWAGLRVWAERLPDHASDRLIAATLAGLVVGRVTAMIVQGVNPVTHPGDLIIVRGGVDTVAATLGFLVTLVWSTRSQMSAVDAVAPSVLAGLAGWHTGCVWRGACLGTQSDLPWAWAQEGSLVTRHPVEIYAAVGLVAAAIIVSRLGWRPWLRAGVALALAACVRWATEALRPSLSGGPTGWYLVAVALGALLIVVGPRLVRTRRHVPT